MPPDDSRRGDHRTARRGGAPARSGGVIRYWFGPDDLGRVRFAIAPVFELAASVDVLREPGAHALHAPWLRWARERVDMGRIELLRAVLGRGGYRPDFVTPPPDTPRPTLSVRRAVTRDLHPARDGDGAPAPGIV